jgi:hypothetical protein
MVMAAGGRRSVPKEGRMRMLWWYGAALLLAVALVVGLDRLGRSDDSAMVVLVALVAAAALLGFAAPRRAWLAGLVIGAAVGVAHLVYATVGPALPYQPSPPGVGGAATLLALVVPGLLGAYLGAGVAWLRHGSH